MAEPDWTRSPDGWYSQVMDIRALEKKPLRLPATDIEALWLDEARRRLMDLDDGLVQAIPAEDVLRKAEALLK